MFSEDDALSGPWASYEDLVLAFKRSAEEMCHPLSGHDVFVKIEAAVQARCIREGGKCGRCIKCRDKGGWRMWTKPLLSRREWRRQRKAWLSR